jgi:MOSC domain-containing protein YiiM
MSTLVHLTREQLEAGLETIRLSPRDRSVLKMIVRRPRVGKRETLREGQLDLVEGLLGDSWIRRGSSRSPDGGPHPDMQLNVMNARAVALIAREEGRWALAGDQLYVDLDLSRDNLPPGARLAIGDAVIEVSALPHTGCGKFVERFGVDAMKFVNGTIGRQLNLRGINARVVQPGTIRVGDTVTKT